MDSSIVDTPISCPSLGAFLDDHHATSTEQCTDSSSTGFVHCKPQSIDAGENKDRPPISSSILLVSVGESDPTKGDTPTFSPIYRSRSTLRSAVRLPSPEQVNHELSRPLIAHNDGSFRIYARPCDRDAVNRGYRGRTGRLRSASPRGVRRLQRECDTLLLTLEKQRYEKAMQRHGKQEVNGPTFSSQANDDNEETEERRDLSAPRQ